MHTSRIALEDFFGVDVVGEMNSETAFVVGNVVEVTLESSIIFLVPWVLSFFSVTFFDISKCKIVADELLTLNGTLFCIVLFCII